MMLIEETSVPDAALPVDAFKAHLRLGSGFGQDSLQDEVLGSFLRAAMAAIELRTGKALIARVFNWTVHNWRSDIAQNLPIAPVSEVTKLTLVERSGAERVADAATYWLEKDANAPRLRASAACLPSIPSGGHVIAELTAGYGAAWDDLPADMRQAVMLLATHYYEYRADTSLGDGCMPFGVTSILERYRMLRIGGAA